MDTRKELIDYFDNSDDTREKFAERAKVGITTLYRYLDGVDQTVRILRKIKNEAKKTLPPKGGEGENSMADERLIDVLTKHNTFLETELADYKAQLKSCQIEIKELVEFRILYQKAQEEIEQLKSKKAHGGPGTKKGAKAVNA